MFKKPPPPAADNGAPVPGHPLAPVLDFLEGRGGDQEQARRQLRAVLIREGLGRDNAQTPSGRLLLALISLAIKPMLQDASPESDRAELLLQRVKSGFLDEELELLLEEVRGITRTLRAYQEDLRDTNQRLRAERRELLGATQPIRVPFPPDSSENRARIELAVTRLISAVRSLGNRQPWLEDQVDDLLADGVQLDDPEYMAQLIAFCERVIDTGASLTQVWGEERSAFVRMITALTDKLREMGALTGGMGGRLSGVIDRLHQSRSLDDLERVRELLVQEASQLKDYTQTLSERLETANSELLHARQRLEAAEEELQKSRQESNTDALTGICNRRAFDSFLNREVARVLRHGGQLTLILFDLDHFKKVNDTFGHAVGDKVLKTVADRVRQSLRQSDLVARYGGEEFVVILPDTDAAAAAAVADNLRHEVAKLRFRTNNQLLQVTSSFGVCPLRVPESSTISVAQIAQRLLESADAALYASKNNGRNRVTTGDMGDWSC
ncbi:MAG: diguanylate cyclase [Magnetococcus sp. WYHC-3]